MTNIVHIIDFTDAHADAIKTLNYEWLEHYFRVEESDVISLSNPQANIIDRGGFIYYAQIGDAIVGTASLLKKSNDVFEFGKMAVTASKQGLRIGTLLLDHCLAVAKQKQIKTLVLYSNTQLAAAIHLYRKVGFIEVPLEKGLYERANIKMQLDLSAYTTD